MNDRNSGLSEFHWGMQILDTIDVGLVVIDREYNVCLWNSFMQSYSDVRADKIMQHNLFSVIKDLPEKWLKSQIDTCIELRNRSFSNWKIAHISSNLKIILPFLMEWRLCIRIW